MKQMKHLYQPCGISCGNTVLKMLINYLDIGNDLTITDLIEICGTDNKTGTTDLKLIKGFNYLNIPYKQNKLKDDVGIDFLKRELSDSFFIMRTLTRNIPHWIMVTSYDTNTKLFNVLDPWLGQIKYDTSEIREIWEPRNFDGFYIKHDLRNKINYIKEQMNNEIPIIEPITSDKDIEDVLELADIIFKDSGMDNKKYINSVADWSISKKLVLDNEIIGFYIFSPNELPVKNTKYNGRGVEGIALGVDEKFMGKGYGKMLINYPYKYMNSNFDYIWGMQLKSLKNIDDWLKRREIVAENDNLYVTAGLL